MLQYWDIWYPKAASTGIPFSRGHLDATEVLLIHAAPPVCTVSIYTEDGVRTAFGQDLGATDETPITRLIRQGATITRRDIWPTQDDLGLLVMLPGGGSLNSIIIDKSEITQ